MFGPFFNRRGNRSPFWRKVLTTPQADAGPDRAAQVNQALSFDGSGSSANNSTLVEWRWNFGDGVISYGKILSHAATRDLSARKDPKSGGGIFGLFGKKK